MQENTEYKTLFAGENTSWKGVPEAYMDAALRYISSAFTCLAMHEVSYSNFSHDFQDPYLVVLFYEMRCFKLRFRELMQPK